jgi:ferritin-like metal-binding protein YciE
LCAHKLPEKRFKEQLVSFKNNNYNSKFSQHLLETRHTFGKIDDIMKILYYDKTGRHLDKIERYYIYRETIMNNQLNDKHRVTCNRIFDTIIKREGNLTDASAPI